MRLPIALFTLLLATLIVSGCTQQEPTGEGGTLSASEQAKALCIGLCEGRTFIAGERESGPCLSDTHEDWNITDWVCDIAHSPRQAVDNQPENQCQEYRSGQAHHFVEVDSNCNFIKAV